MDQHTADRDARIERYRPYAHALAADFIPRLPAHVDKNDVLGYAELGLVEAATTFDPAGGADFKTFAYYRVRGAIYDGLRRLGGMPREFYRRLKFERAANAFLEDYSAQPPRVSTDAQYNELRNITGSIVSTFLLSLDALAAEPAAASSGEPDRCLERTEREEQIRDAVKRLPEKNRRVIEDYYFRDRTLEEIAKSLSLSKSWVCRLHARGIEMLRTMMDAPAKSVELVATVGTAAR